MLIQDSLNVKGCYQCMKCSTGCPVVRWMDYKPHQVIQMVNLGMAERLLSSRTIWICSACSTCTTRCPNDIDVAQVMDRLRQVAAQEKRAPAEKEIFIFHKVFLNSIRAHGRVHELSMIARYKMAAGRYLDDMKLGWTMFMKGKLRLIPSNVANKKDLPPMFAGWGR